MTYTPPKIVKLRSTADISMSMCAPGSNVTPEGEAQCAAGMDGETPQCAVGNVKEE
jgi:hypothetical protein